VKPLTAAQMREVDDLAINTYGINLYQMMELAGSTLARLAIKLLEKRPDDIRVSVLVGKGNNGGGGLVAVRHLHNMGVEVKILLSQKDHQKPSINHHLKGIKKIKIPITYFQNHQDIIGSSDLILDCLLGYNVVGEPRTPINQIINIANDSGNEILSLDLPSGLDATTGIPGNPCIKASYTMTLALPKKGLFEKQARDYVGEIFLADIGIPPEIYSEIGIEVGHIFNQSNLIKI
jgi:NAD(P)H-hydrate epimerase